MYFQIIILRCQSFKGKNKIKQTIVWVYLMLVFLYDHLEVKFKQYVVRANDITVNEYGVGVD